MMHTTEKRRIERKQGGLRMVRGPFVVMEHEKSKSRFLILKAGSAFCYKSSIFTVVLGCSNNLCTLNRAY